MSIPLFNMPLAPPVITGEALTGHFLQTSLGPFPLYGYTYSHEWFRNGVKVATGSRYRLTEADLGKTLTVKVTVKAPGYNPASRTSSPTNVVAPGSFTPATPMISGEAKGGVMLTAQPGSWGLPAATFTYQWYRSGVPIPGATYLNYFPSGPDLDKTLSVMVTASASGVETASKMSDPTGPVVPGTLNDVAPEISGAASLKVGQYLGLKFPGATYGASYKYQWYRNGTAIGGATKSTYYPGADDLGTNTYTVHATVSRSGYTSYSKTSTPFAATVNKGDFTQVTDFRVFMKPSIASTWMLDQILWSPSPTLKKQWYRDGVAVKGATGESYRPTVADLGTHTYKVVVTGSKVGYNTVTKSKTFSLTVQKANLYAHPDSKISGTAKAGYTLTATPPSFSWWHNNFSSTQAKPAVKYQWYRSSTAIKGATGKSYKLTGADAGKTIKVRFTATLPGYNTLYPHSKSTKVVAKGTLKTSTPTISGTKKVGYRLTANPRTWTAGTKFKYQWYRSGKAIKGATGSTYKLVSADRYDSIKVRVTGYQTGWNTLSRYSGSTTKVR
jgi:hypothetical protein